MGNDVCIRIGTIHEPSGSFNNVDKCVDRSDDPNQYTVRFEQVVSTYIKEGHGGMVRQILASARSVDVPRDRGVFAREMIIEARRGALRIRLENKDGDDMWDGMGIFKCFGGRCKPLVEVESATGSDVLTDKCYEGVERGIDRAIRELFAESRE